MIRPSGFSLIEMLFVLFLISILSNFAYSGYKSYIMKIKRYEGRASLLDLANTLENYFIINEEYPVTEIDKFSIQSPHGWYQLQITDITASTYELEAENHEDNSECQLLTLNNIGVKGKNSTCWQ